jgi:hypothetical protein
MTFFPWDNTVGLGSWPFRIQLAPDHPFYGPYRVHDAEYQLIKEGKAKKNLHAIDLDFLNDCLRNAASCDLYIDKIALIDQAYMMYGICRLWAKYVRPTFEAWQPGEPAPTL